MERGSLWMKVRRLLESGVMSKNMTLHLSVVVYFYVRIEFPSAIGADAMAEFSF